MAKIYPIGGGKGGIGKSFITSNLGASLAKKGKKVLLVDLDLGGSNLHTFIGQNNLLKGLDSFISKKNNNLESVAVSTDIRNLFFINSSNCSLEVANLYSVQKMKIIRALRQLEYDYILLDLGAGLHYNILDFFLTSSQGIFVCTSEPTSIENAFKFIKAVYFRIIKKTLKQQIFKRVTKDIDFTKAGVNQSFEIIKKVTESDRKKGLLLKKRLSSFEFRLIMNQVRKNDDTDLGKTIEKVCNRHFHSQFKFLGNIRYDEKVYDSIVLKKTFINKYSYTQSATDIADIAGNIINEQTTQKSISPAI